MRLFVFLIMIVLAIMVQTTALQVVRIWGIIPDLVMILVIFNGFLRGTREGAFLGLTAGLLLDFAAGGYLGLNALTMLLAGYLAGIAESRLYKDNLVIVMGLVGLITVVSQLVYYLLLLYVGVFVQPGVVIFRTVLPTALYNILMVPLLYWNYYRSSRTGWLKYDV